MGDESLSQFIDDVCGESRLRVEADLGDGFVRLRSSEAERRQAAQDIRCSEDAVIELLRNARDAGASHIFVATQKSGAVRTVTVVDDGCGIPEAHQERIFEPRVTSKLDTAHMDKWGMHGRGMALYSIAVNALAARVQASAPGAGASLWVQTDTGALPEKTDQSTFPRFEEGEGGVMAMRGPKNIVRTVAEFALEHRSDCTVFFGSPTEVAATLVAFGMATLPPSVRAFCADATQVPLVKRLALAPDADALARACEAMGLEMSSRSARRILDGSIAPVPSMADRLRNESFPAPRGRERSPGGRPRDGRGLHLAEEDVGLIRRHLSRAMDDIAERYYLEGVGEAQVTVSGDAIRITVPVRKQH